MNVKPDFSLGHDSTQRSDLHTIAAVRRFGLYIPMTFAANTILAEHTTELPDWLGDDLSNRTAGAGGTGSHRVRHDGVNSAIYDAINTVATHRVVLGDREKRHEYQQYNDGHVADIIRPGQSLWGTNWIGETKVISPYDKTQRVGNGTDAHGGSRTDFGHAFAFGNTEEKLHLQIMGCKARGLPSDPPLNHATGEGWVHAHIGDYADPLTNKNNVVIPLIAETFGGLGRELVRTLKFLARSAGNIARGRDSTDYGRAPALPGPPSLPPA